jgi:type II secretory pathway component PulF
MDRFASQKHFLYLEMAKFLRTGVGIQKAVETLKRGRSPVFQTEVLDSIQNGIARGESIAAAFAALVPKVSSLECTLIEAGEKSGTLGVVLQHLGVYFELLAQMQAQARRGLIYPAALLHLAVFSQSLPAVFAAHDASLVSNLATLLGPLPLVYAGSFVAFLALKRLLDMAPNDAAIDRMFHMLPWVGKARIHAAMARFCRVYHCCLMAGMSVAGTFQAALDAAGSGILRAASVGVLDCIKKGELLGPAFVAEPEFPRMFSLVYSSGETAGTLDTDLQRLSEQYQQEARESMQAAGASLPKVMTVGVMAYAIYKIVAFYSIYFSAMRSFSE